MNWTATSTTYRISSTDKGDLEMVMKFTEFLKLNSDTDVSDDYVDEVVAVCGPVKLTQAGQEEFKALLNLSIDVQPKFSEAVVSLDDLPNCEELSDLLHKFLWYAAGYCSTEEYNRLFEEVE